MKKLALIFALVLAGCAATPGRDASLVLQRMYSQFKVASANDDYAAARASLVQARDEYNEVMGESPLFDRWIALFLRVLEIDEEQKSALPDPIQARLEALGIEVPRPETQIIREIIDLAPLIGAEIQQAQRDADRRAENAAALATTLGAMIGGFAGGVAGSSAASGSTYQAPAPSTPTTCTVIPAGRNTVTGQPYGPSYVYCR